MFLWCSCVNWCFKILMLHRLPSTCHTDITKEVTGREWLPWLCLVSAILCEFLQDVSWVIIICVIIHENNRAGLTANVLFKTWNCSASSDIEVWSVWVALWFPHMCISSECISFWWYATTTPKHILTFWCLCPKSAHDVNVQNQLLTEMLATAATLLISPDWKQCERHSQQNQCWSFNSG